MSDTNFSQILLNCQSDNQSVRADATNTVQKMEQQNLVSFFL